MAALDREDLRGATLPTGGTGRNGGNDSHGRHDGYEDDADDDDLYSIGGISSISSIRPNSGDARTDVFGSVARFETGVLRQYVAAGHPSAATLRDPFNHNETLLHTGLPSGGRLGVWNPKMNGWWLWQNGGGKGCGKHRWGLDGLLMW